ncbi:MAG: hypothetical protein KUL77_12065 [Thermomonas sp.]|uniref:hypothetical protein n=1 Tax=Thermomonas sp. TaxID=1971895 RepID=UPI001ECA2EF7|nr:hypothetical protein [Thermomonas sp.]MBV2210283.1 hypothetical protein [Thermomonas sp.]
MARYFGLILIICLFFYPLPSLASDPAESNACLNPNPSALPSSCVFFENAKNVLSIWISKNAVTNYLVCGPNYDYSSKKAFATYVHQNNYNKCSPSLFSPINPTDPRFTVSWSVLCPSGSAFNQATKSCSVVCPSGQIQNSITNQCMDSCSGRANKSSVTYSYMIPNGSIGCDSGCMYIAQSNGDGTYSNTFFGDGESFHCIASPTNCGDNGPGWTMNYGLNMCVPPLDECKSNEVKDPVTGMCKVGCPSGMSADSTGMCKPESNTCPAGETKGPDGSCIKKPDACGEGKTAGADGTCKKDGDTDKDDGDDDKYFSGGDSCSSPPACSGDPIMCGQARIQWRIDCNTRRNVNISGGACNAMPVCTGDLCGAMEYSQLLMQWRTACALEKDKSATGGEGDEGQPGWTKVDGMNQDAGQGEGAGDTQGVQTKTQSLDSLDSGGWLGGVGSCPAIMAGGGDGLGGSFAQSLASPPAYFCQFIGMMAAIVLLGASVVSSVILARG